MRKYMIAAAIALLFSTAAAAGNKEIGPMPKITVVGDYKVGDVIVPWAIKADITIDGEIDQTLVFNIDEGEGFGKRIFKDEADCLAFLATPPEIFTSALDGLKIAAARSPRGVGIVTIRCATDAPSHGI